MQNNTIYCYFYQEVVSYTCTANPHALVCTIVYAARSLMIAKE